MSSTSVSVVIATRNAARFLDDCLTSVMRQSLRPLEILVVDAASTDDTVAVAGRFPLVRIVPQVGLGFAAAWNQGIAAAKGDTIAFVDSDDRWMPDKLALQVAMLDADEALEGAIGRVRFFVEPGETPPAGWRDRILKEARVAQMPGVLLARRRLFEKLGNWGTNWQIASDIDWFVKLKDSRLPIGVVDAVLLEKRIHSSNLSLVTARDRVYPDELLRLLHASIERKRASGAA